jgi:hypothetical protein
MLTIIVDRLEHFDQQFFPFALKGGKHVKHLICYDLKLTNNNNIFILNLPKQHSAIHLPTCFVFCVPARKGQFFCLLFRKLRQH